MADVSSTYMGPIYLKGDMIASSPHQPIQTPGLNPGQQGFGMVVENAQALGTQKDLYRLVWYSNQNASATEFQNGQWWRLEKYSPAQDSDGAPFSGNEGWSTLYSNLAPKHDLVAGAGGGDEYIVLEAQGTGGLHLLYDINGGLPGTPTTLTYLGKDQNGDPLRGDEDSNLDFQDAYKAAPCFSRGTLIETDHGPVAIEKLAVGDLVVTRDHGLQPIRWIGSRLLSGAALTENLRPVLIRRHALGDNAPSADLLVSPQHRILVRSAIAQRMFGTDEVLVAAKQLCQMDGIDIVEGLPAVEYFHMLFDRHEVVISNGAETESFFTGPVALESVGPQARAEILTIFPELADCDHRPVAARTLVPGRLGRKLAARHAHNGRPLVS